MKSTSYKIKLRASVNGVDKIPTKIAFINGDESCLVTPCYKENDYLVVELLPDCVGNSCIEGYLLFDDTCTHCEPLHFKRCFCDTNADCEDCEECNELGICQSECLEDEFCSGNKCVECDSTNPCPDGKICIGDRCTCPQGSFEKNGKCIECDDTTVLNNCQECIKGKIVDKPCDGRCDPGTGNCVDCIASGDCYNRADGRNCCDLTTKQCVCCPGTAWSAEQNKCVPVSCVDDEDCGDPCLKCTADGCKPMLCPPGMKCWNGDCVDWPCESTSCDNGGDCGEDCGCLEVGGIKRCIPCAVLECMGECESALGCKCADNKKCISVKDCGDYCDGLNPCLDANCTCYNNKCIDCSNFPCNPNDCSDRPNCGCDGGDCGGNGAGCDDKLTLSKFANCSTVTGCELKADFKSNSCKCAAITFKTKYVDNTDVKFKVNMFKGNVPYADYLNQKAIGNDELVTGSLVTTVDQFVFTKGSMQKISSVVLPSTSLGGNLEKTITLTSSDFSKEVSIIEDGMTKNVRTIIEVTIKAVGVKILNNLCDKYKDAVIAKYTLDYRSITNTNDILSIKAERKANVNDSISQRKPLFIWSKSSSDAFGASKFLNNKVYSNNGYFRKEYGTKQGTNYTDKINNTINGSELWNNYNYKVEVDCGCKTNQAFQNNLVFCCPVDITPQFSKCNKHFIIPSFKTCAVNGLLSGNSTISAPMESQTQYVVSTYLKDGTIATATLESVFSNPNMISEYIYEGSTRASILYITIAQKYSDGTLLEGDNCLLTITPDPVEEVTPQWRQDCDYSDTEQKITVTQLTGAVRISKIEMHYNSDGYTTESIDGGNYDINQEKSAGSTYEFILPKYNEGLAIVLVMKLTNGCTSSIKLKECPRIITTTENPVGARSSKDCGGTGVTANTEAFGFTSSDEITYTISGGDLLEDITNNTGTFNNLGAGRYQITATQGSISSTTTLVVAGQVIPLSYLSPATICSGQTSTLFIEGTPGDSYSVSGPGIGTNILIPVSGKASIPGLILDGDYSVSLNAEGFNPCIYTNILKLTVGGQVLTPSLVFKPGTYCVGEEIPFRIFDNNVGATYRLVTSSGSVTTPVVAISSGFNAVFTPSAINSSVTIQSAVDSCNTMSPVTMNLPASGVNVVNGPIISSPIVVCTGSLKAVTVQVLNTTGVTIGGITATKNGDLYTVSGITASTVDIVAYSASCTVTKNVTLNGCDCPNLAAVLNITPATCGQGSQDLFFTAYSSELVGYNYNLQKLDGGVWTNIIGKSGIFSDNLVLTINNTLGVNTFYRFYFDNSTGCTYTSNEVHTEAVQPPSISIYGPSTAMQGETITLTTLGGDPYNTSYQWSGPSSDSTPSTTVIMGGAGSYTFTVTTITGPCTITKSHIVTVGGDCVAGPTISNILKLGPCENPTPTVIGGGGSLSYAWSSVPPGSDQTTEVYDASQLAPGVAVTLTLVVTDEDGCSSSPMSVPYTRCAGGCDCEYELLVTDYEHISTWAVYKQATTTNLHAVISTEITKNCADGPHISEVATGVKSSLGRTAFSISIEASVTPLITSMDVIRNGVPETLSIPSSYLGGNPQTNPTVLASYLTSENLGATFKVSLDSRVYHNILASNTGGFNTEYVNNGSTKNYTVDSSGQFFISFGKGTGCKKLTYSKMYDATPVGSESIIAGTNYTATYNDLIYNGTHTSNFTTNNPDHNPTGTCQGCNF